MESPWMYNRYMNEKQTYKKLCAFSEEERKMIREMAKMEEEKTGKDVSTNQVIRLAIRERYAKKARSTKKAS